MVEFAEGKMAALIKVATGFEVLQPLQQLTGVLVRDEINWKCGQQAPPLVVHGDLCSNQIEGFGLELYTTVHIGFGTGTMTMSEWELQVDSLA